MLINIIFVVTSIFWPKSLKYPFVAVAPEALGRTVVRPTSYEYKYLTYM